VTLAAVDFLLIDARPRLRIPAVSVDLLLE
jgi:hypothetical protein